jgi:hypothetical protein
MKKIRKNVVAIILMVLALVGALVIALCPVNPLWTTVAVIPFIIGLVVLFVNRKNFLSVLLWTLLVVSIVVMVSAIIFHSWFWFFFSLLVAMAVLAIMAYRSRNIVAIVALIIAVVVLFFSIIFCGMDIIAGNRGNVVDGDLIVNGDVILPTGDVTLEHGDVNVGGDANVEGDANIGGNANVEGDANIGGDANVEGDANIGGDANVEGDVNVDGDINVTEPPATEPPATEPPATEPPATEPPATEPPHEHSYTSKVTKEATCTNDGVRTYTCTCGKSYTESIAKLGHGYTSKVVAPTTEAKGYTLYTCSKCGDSYKDNYTDKLVQPKINAAGSIRYGETVYVNLEGINASDIKVSNKLFVTVEVINDNRVAITLIEDVAGYITITDTVSKVNVVIDIAE